MAVWLMAGTLEAFASGEAYGLGDETIGQAEQALKYAAIQSPRWHYRRDAIERDVSDIAFLLDQAWRARQRFESTRSGRCICCGGRSHGGIFTPEHVEPVLTVIRRFLPNGPV